jgi:hypothetical protein
MTACWIAGFVALAFNDFRISLRPVSLAKPTPSAEGLLIPEEVAPLFRDKAALL